jgi:Flp pilus assembly pilin Flp
MFAHLRAFGYLCGLLGLLAVILSVALTLAAWGYGYPIQTMWREIAHAIFAYAN